MSGETLPLFEERVMPPVDAAFLKQHKPSRWRSFTTEDEVLSCCGQNFGPVSKPTKRGAPDAWDLWADHVAAVSASAHDPRCISLTDSEFNASCDCSTLRMVDAHHSTERESGL